MNDKTASMRARLDAAQTLADLDALYVEWVGYSIAQDDAAASTEGVRDTLADYIDEIEMAAAPDPVKDESDAENQARAQVASIVAMVAALECDYERLEELRGERGDFVINSPLSADDAAYKWRADNPSEAEELADLEEAAGDCESEEEARQRILDDALSVEVRSGWTSVGETLQPEEFRIVLCTGGPHVEILGELDDSNEPDRVRIIYKDWGTSGELFDFDRDAVSTYCRQFYFGD